MFKRRKKIRHADNQGKRYRTIIRRSWRKTILMTTTEVKGWKNRVEK